MSTRALLSASLLLACAPAPPAREPAPAPAPAAAAPADPPARPLPPELVGLVQPWHAFDRELAEASPVWLLARYQPGTYPCVEGPNGELDMLLQDRLVIEKVLRGQVAAPGIDLDLHALRRAPAPRAFAAGRRYLLFLRPGPKAQAQLADPQALGGLDRRLGPPDVAHVVDVDQARVEADVDAWSERSTAAGRSGAHALDPALWARLRAAAAPEPASQRSLAVMLREVVLKGGPSLADIRPWLARPDDLDLGPGLARRERYILARPAYEQPAEGGIYGDLELRFDAALRLRHAELKYLRWHVRPREQSSIALTPAEHDALGLPRFELSW